MKRLAETPLVEAVDDTPGYYRISEEGIAYSNNELSVEVVKAMNPDPSPEEEDEEDEEGSESEGEGGGEAGRGVDSTENGSETGE